MNVFILRTHFFSELWFDYLKIICTKMKVIIVADYSSGYFNYDGFEHIHINDQSCKDLELSTIGNYKWRCGDYAYYLVYDKYKFQKAWLAEADVYIDFNNVLDFLDSYENIDCDFLCTYYKFAEKNWYWYDKLQGYDKKYSCFMPLTRINGDILDKVISLRIKEKGVSNDEIFLATIISSFGTVKDIECLNHELYDNLSFCYRVIKVETTMKFLNFIRGNSNKIYHPVTSFSVFLKKSKQKSYLKSVFLTFISRFFYNNKKKLF